MPFNTVFRIHPDLDDYIINFNLEYYTRYKRCFVEASDPNVDFYFLIRRPKDYIVDFETMQLDPDMVDAENLRDALINNSVETRKVIALPVMPEFNASRDILKVITSENLNDIWRHWLAAQYGDRLLNPSENYYSRCVHDNWVDDVVGHLVLQNMIEARKPSELDPGLKRLLGI